VVSGFVGLAGLQLGAKLVNGGCYVQFPTGVQI